LGQHNNRAILYDVNGNFRTTISTSEAERLADFGDAMRVSRLKERPLRVRLLISRPAQPRPGAPTSGCTSAASITAADTEAAVGITRGPGGANMGRVKLARAKIDAFRVVQRAGKGRESRVAAVTSAGGCGASAVN
jgi:hypothetical protein